MTEYKGGCACGEVSYLSEKAPLFAFHCQCRKCQRITGSGHSSQIAFPTESVVFSREPTYYRQIAEGGVTTKSGFCEKCGSPIMTQSEGYPEVMFIHAASLDDPTLFKPQQVAWHESAQAWDHVDPELPIHQRG